MKDRDEIRKSVRIGYAEIAKGNGKSGCGSGRKGGGCCNGSDGRSKDIGYTEGDLKSVPDCANLGLGCGNHVAFASIKYGETVLDLGSGAGLTAFWHRIRKANLAGLSGSI